MSKKKNKRQSTRRLPAQGTVRTGEFNPDYTTTRLELRRIGILVGSIFVILVILSIFQEQILALFMK